MRIFSLKEARKLRLEIQGFEGSFDKKYYRFMFLGMLKETRETNKSMSYIFPLDSFDYKWLKGLSLRGYRFGLNIDPNKGTLRVKVSRKQPLRRLDISEA